ncbi:MATE family efflux transporter [Clostridium sp. DL1XJH146]
MILSAKKINTTEGSIKKNLWLLAYPIIIGNLIQIFYNFGDTFWVSKLPYGTEAVASVSIVFSVVFLLMSFIMGFSGAAATLISQFFGAGRNDDVEEVAYTTINIFNALSICIVVFSLLFGKAILRFMKTPEEIMVYALDYYYIIIIGMIFMFVFYYLSALLRGIGDTTTPMIAGILSGIFNLVLDPFLILGIGPFPYMGIKGAAYATVISRVIVAVFLFYVTFKKDNLMNLKLRKLVTFNKDFAASIVKIGIPASFSNVVISLGWIIIVSRVNSFGAYASAVYGIGNRIDSAMFQLSGGIQQALATVVGQNIGANKIERVKESISYALKASFVLIMSLSLIILFLPEQIFRIFSSDPTVIEMGKMYVWCLAGGYAFVCCRMVLVGAFQGAGATAFSMILSMISLWIFRVPMAYAFSYTTMGIDGVWFGLGTSFVISYVFMYVCYKRYDWLGKGYVLTLNNNNKMIAQLAEKARE